jgi:hypothetical protein
MSDQAGQKFDDGKIRYDLIPLIAEELFARVLTFGARKYAPDNWKKVPNWERRYFAAARRHMSAWAKWKFLGIGSRLDPDTENLPHLACAMCCVAFLLEQDEVSSGRDSQDEDGLPSEIRKGQKPVLGRSHKRGS